MKSLSLISFACLFISAALFAQTPDKYKPADYQQFKNLSAKEVTILPKKFLREYDPLTVFFTSDVHPTGAGPEDFPEKVVQVSPAHPGEYRWLDSRTLEFRPTIPWPPMRRFKIKIGVTETELSTLLMPPVSISPENGAADLGAVDKVGLEFKYNVDPEILAKLITFEACPLPGIGKEGCKTFTAADYRIKIAEQTAGSSHFKYWFVMNKPFGLGLKVRTYVRLSDDPTLSEALQTYAFNTKEEFRLEKAGTNEHQFTVNPDGSNYTSDQALRISSDGVLIFDFTAAPAELTLSQVKSFVNLSPAPHAFEFRLYERRLTVNVTVDTDRLYKVTLEPVPFRDRENRTLVMKRSSSFYFHQPKERSFIQWTQSYGILERFGPQHFPLRVAGVKSLDLRIHRLDPLNKAFWPFPEAPVPVDENQRRPGPGEEPSVEREILNPLNTSEIISHIQMLSSPHYSAIIDLEREGVIKHNSLDLKPKLAEISGANAAGTYLLGFRRLEGDPERQYVKIQVTDLCLSTVESKDEVVFAVTSYSTGQAVANAKIRIEGVKLNRFETIFSGVTDAQGLLKVTHNEALRKNFELFNIKRAVVEKDSDFLVIDTRQRYAPPQFADNHWYGSSSGWLEWLSNRPYNFSQDRTFKAHLFTERPIYRPEEKVYFKGYVRSRFQGGLTYINQDTFSLKVLSPSGAEWNFDLKLTAEGSFAQEFQEKDLPTGVFTANLIHWGRGHGAILAAAEFKMEAYRLPLFEVKLHGPDRAPNDQPFTVQLTASYYAGGVVVNQPVKWRVTSFPYSHQPKGLEGYLLSSDSRYGATSYESKAGPLEDDQTTDDNGQTKIVVNPQLELDGNPRRYNCEATVTGADQQTVSNRYSVVALPPFVLGLKTERYIKSGNAISAQIVAIDVNDSLAAGHEVTVRLKKMSWISYLQETDFAMGKPQYVTNEQVELKEEKKIKTIKGPVAVRFENQEPGVYIIEVDGKDKLGRLQTVKVDLFLAGDKPLAWQKPEQMVFETAPDKTSYQPGEIAHVVLKSPYQHALALAVTEMPDGKPQYKWFTVANGQATFDLEILPTMIPRVPVSFLLMRPRVAQPKVLPEGQKVDLGKPETVANTTWLNIEPVTNRVYVELQHEKVVLPGSQLAMTILLKDSKSKPLPGEVTLWLIDEAVLALAPEGNLDPLEKFIDPVRSHVSIRDTRNMAVGDLRFRENPGGDGEAEEESGLGKITVRKTFKTVPYYNPRVMVDATGKAVVTIPMPDNLTNFAIRAVAVSGPDKFGLEKSLVSVRLPVIVQPALPRFVRIGDKLKAGGVARVVEGTGGTGLYSMKTSGANILTTAGAKAELTGNVTLPDKEALPIYLDMEIPAPGYDDKGEALLDSVTFQIAVQRSKDKAGDAFQIKIPLLPDRRAIITETFARLTADSAVTWEALKERPRPNTLNRQLIVSDQLAILKSLAALRYLIQYPHGCAEQRISRAYPSLAYTDIFGQLGMEPPDPNLQAYVNQTLEYLAKVQKPDGLFSYWPGSQGYVYFTAYVVEFLLEVQKANQSGGSRYNLDEAMLSSALEALKRAIRSDYTQFLDGYKYYERSAALYALTLAGRGDVAYLRELASQTTQVDLLSQARICKTIYDSKASLGAVTTNLEKQLWDNTIFKLEKGQEVFAGLQQRSMRIGARVHASEITNLAGLISAFSASKSSPKKLGMMVDELVTLGGVDGWGQTNVNSAALFALRDNILAGKKSGVTAKLSLNTGAGFAPMNYEGNKGAFKYAWKTASAGSIRLEENPQKREFFVNLAQSYLPQALGSAAEAAQRGFVVKRELIRVSKTEAPSAKIWIDKSNTSHTFAVGDILEEHIQVVNSSDRYFVAVAAPVAAGFEPLNPNLAISSSEAIPSGQTSNKGDYQAYLDDRVVFYFDAMPAGTYDFYFRLRATTAGEFTHPPAEAEMMYDQKVRGNSPGAKVIVTEK